MASAHQPKFTVIKGVVPSNSWLAHSLLPRPPDEKHGAACHVTMQAMSESVASGRGSSTQRANGKVRVFFIERPW